VDVVLSSSDEAAHSPTPDASTDPKVSAVDDAANMGAISIKATIPDRIGAGAPNILRSPITDQAPTIPPSGGHG
jgi:hypothetical protein